MPLQLPNILEKFQEKVDTTLNHTIRIKPSAQAPIYLWQSKIGGKPHWPKGMDYPKSKTGEWLFFLAQLNFAEIPALEGFPTKGILQFFIAADGMFGLDFDHPQVQDNFRVMYHAEVIEDSALLESDFAFLPHFDQDTPLPPHSSFALNFSQEEEWLGPPDYRFDQVYSEAFLADFGEEQEEVMDFFYELGSKASGHKLGGYAFFTQCDPRDPAVPMQLLFQMDSDNDINTMWGDMGIANFFIRPEDLQALRFDRVLYNWDCA